MISEGSWWKRAWAGRVRAAVAIAAIVAVGVVLRVARLDAVPFWSDEAESAINALTILQHGHPTDSYLDLPIFENTLVEPWPGHPEYEFRDSSYSRGVAVYHGWLPLYSIAASLALYGVQPDEPSETFALRHDLEEQKKRTRAGRAPAVLFGALLLPVVYFAGKRMYGSEAGWAALIFASAHDYLIQMSRQSRYYSATLLLTTSCCFAAWLMITEGRWKHYLWGGLLFVLLFYTHLLSFAAGCLTLAVMTPWILVRQSGSFPKLLAFGGIVLSGAAPWIWRTGFLTHLGQLPRGWELMSLPGDLIALPPADVRYLIVFAAFAVLLAYLWIREPGWSAGVAEPLLDARRPIAMLAIWVGSGYACFLLFTPAASFFGGRLNLSYWGPIMLGLAIICASAARAIAARVIAARRSWLVAPVLMIGTATLVSQPFAWRPARYQVAGWDQLEAVLTGVESIPVQRPMKLYASPNDHLIYAYYSGLPFQSIMPVRREFLDHYEGDVVFVDAVVGEEDLGARLQSAAKEAHQSLDPSQAVAWARLLFTHDYRSRMLRLTGAGPPADELPPFVGSLLARFREERRDALIDAARPGFILRGFDVNLWADWSNIFFYRFVDPASRSGPNSNYAARLRGSTGVILPDLHKAIYYSPSERPDAELRFEFR